MANGITAADHVTLNLGEGGAVIATDFVDSTSIGYGSAGTDGGNGPAHFQVVKLSTGGAGEVALLSKTAPVFASIASIGDSGYLANGYLAIRGNTMGDQAVPVSLSGATLEVNSITIVGGTIDQIANGVSADIRSVASGVTFSVVGPGSRSGGDQAVFVGTTATDTVAVTGAVDIANVALPVGITSFTKTFNDSTLQTFNGFTLSSGVKVKNYYSGLEGLTPGASGPGGGLLCVGYTGALVAGASTGYLLSPGEEVFIEINNVDKILATSVNFDSAESFCHASILGT
tara:strand:- start:12 stop:872 length:861 start_codon:yes stop_codon:yes gene_type:complete